MKIAVIGSGGREHALALELSKSKACEQLVCIPGNGGMAASFPCVPIKISEIAKIVDYCRNNHVDYVVVGPDDPLALGLVDALEEKGIPAFGPHQKAAQIEASKVFAKKLMQEHGIPTGACHIFDRQDQALAFLQSCPTFPLVIKADGLALGKGVLICQDRPQAVKAVRDMMEHHVFGAAGDTIVVEEFLTGPEVSVLAFCDGSTLVPLVSSMDHKRALDGDQGKNTGGMGAIAPNPCYTPELAQQCMEEIFMPTVRAMQEAGTPFKGCLFFGLMLTPQGPKVIEYNCRFGDPETQAVLPLLEMDLLEVMLACTQGKLDARQIKVKSGYSACVVMASGGYPDAYETGYPIHGLEAWKNQDGCILFHSGTRLEKGQFITSGGRVLCLSARGDTLSKAVERCYKKISKITFKYAHYRKDIGNTVMQHNGRD